MGIEEPTNIGGPQWELSPEERIAQAESRLVQVQLKIDEIHSHIPDVVQEELDELDELKTEKEDLERAIRILRP